MTVVPSGLDRICSDPPNSRKRSRIPVALMLNILCGFSVDEVAGAFLSTHAAIEKRISRAKKVLAPSKKLFDVSRDSEFSSRLPAVQRALYLLFNEGVSWRFRRERSAGGSLP